MENIDITICYDKGNNEVQSLNFQLGPEKAKKLDDDIERGNLDSNRLMRISHGKSVHFIPFKRLSVLYLIQCKENKLFFLLKEIDLECYIL
jgi:hypothetical protein